MKIALQIGDVGILTLPVERLEFSQYSDLDELKNVWSFDANSTDLIIIKIEPGKVKDFILPSNYMRPGFDIKKTLKDE